jgi:hypothetical protein
VYRKIRTKDCRTPLPGNFLSRKNTTKLTVYLECNNCRAKIKIRTTELSFF